jgi:hypothetical protein
MDDDTVLASRPRPFNHPHRVTIEGVVRFKVSSQEGGASCRPDTAERAGGVARATHIWTLRRLARHDVVTAAKGCAFPEGK